MSKKIKYAKVYLPESEMPKYWYNVMADMPNPIKPYISPATGKPVVPDELSAIFPPELIKQELTTEREIEIPQPVRDVYRQYRPSPLVRAIGLEKALDTPAKIYYKYEGNNPSGSHKLNTALAQAFYNKEAGIKRLTTETGAGQWGTALSVAGAIFGLDVEVYMVKVSYQQKPYRKILMNTYGANVYASPSDRTEAGRAMLAEDPNGLGSLGGAISEAIEVAAQNDDTNYALGSVLNHVGLHQSIIGLEAIKQFEMMDDYPDYVI
ncbi:MAG: TrpB-like pyridoxal phosphate-dependent enzyme, partial [Christensenellaceae bacterium]